MYARLVLLCLFLLPFAFSSPAQRTVHENVLAKAEKAYIGIKWDLALRDCGESRLKPLVEATRMAIQLTKRPSQPVSTPGCGTASSSPASISRKGKAGWGKALIMRKSSASRCSEYAWLYADKKKANSMVKENGKLGSGCSKHHDGNYPWLIDVSAENYAWY
ncbi:hypothetical protein BO86DRAFT_401432 [Aspergillus japonicus CBS 114.51]|uniref:SCP domain-containing protein n=1 Tax=Aspergillus japonicus CBS 114.51 TaxID=1448312 RepID=A0A8T8WWK0_ASPJA|nr:hypothetical protein BO86DRAFT_401432 [Aspergillus japonicus CBS 114.51]RAH79792.1 hypothetical protein BO86DRAFT_401432 [Aspergillus japonicus CBS 114.51]